MEPTIFNTTARVNVRTRPSRTANIAEVLEAGRPVNIADLHDGWAETTEGEFIMRDFLERSQPEEEVDHEVSE